MSQKPLPVSRGCHVEPTPPLVIVSHCDPLRSLVDVLAVVASTTPGAPAARATVVQWLRAQAGKHCQAAREALAKALGVTLRTLRNYARPAGDGSDAVVLSQKRGRKPAAPEVRYAAYQAVQRMLREAIVLPSPREVDALLESERQHGRVLPSGLVRRYAGAITRARRKARANAQAAARLRVTVFAPNVLWSADATHLDGNPQRTSAVYAETVVDVATSETLDLSAGDAPTEKDVVESLERSRQERGTLPLAFMTDGGPENCGEEVERYLHENQVVHIRNLPHTPQHNPHVERKHRTVKEALEATGALPRLDDRSGWQQRLRTVQRELNEVRRMRSRGWLTPRDYHARLPSWYPVVDRGTFYATACAAVARAVEGIEDPRARRMAARNAQLDTLEAFHLIRRTRGRARPPAPKTEIN